MKFVILSNKKIPGFGGIKGPILTPQEIPLKKVLNMVSLGFEVFEVMEDGSRRKVQFSDERILSEMIKQKLTKKFCKVYPPIDSVTLVGSPENKSDLNIFEKTSVENIDAIVDIEKSAICNATRGKDENKESEEKQSKKDKKNNKSYKKPELPKIDDVEEISDDK